MPDLRRPRHSVVVPRRRRRRSALRRVLYSLMLLAGCTALTVLAVGLYGYKKFAEPGPLAADTTFQVPRGGVRDVAAELERARIITSAYAFTAAAQLTGDRGRLKPGEYQFKQAMSMRDVMALIVSGKIITYKINIPEGWTTAQALDRLRENDVLTGDISLAPAEGEIMPDTYVFQRGESRDHIVRSMMTASHKLMDDLWPQRAPDLPVKTPAEALTLASIIEKETGVPEERSRVASVFVNRLKSGMRLQSDPTIIYGITSGKMKLDRPLTKRDIARATPYNTYQINGLPPGPIANPGRAAIEAALAPAKTNDLYFVADGSGGHVFAARLEDHRVNVRKWRVIEKQRNQGSEESPVMDEEEASDAVAGPGTAATAPDTAAVPAKPAVDAEAPAPAAVPQTQAETGTAPAITAPETTAVDTQVPSASDQVPASSVPRPRPKPEVKATTTDLADAAVDLKPGSIIRGERGLIPIPMPKPKAP